MDRHTFSDLELHLHKGRSILVFGARDEVSLSLYAGIYLGYTDLENGDLAIEISPRIRETPSGINTTYDFVDPKNKISVSLHDIEWIEDKGPNRTGNFYTSQS